MTNNVLWTKSNTTAPTTQKGKHKNPCKSRESNRGPLAPQPNALPLHHRSN